MGAMQQMLMGGGDGRAAAIVKPIPITMISDIETGAPASASIQFVSATGLIAKIGNATAAGAAWAIAPFTAANYWVRMTLLGGNANTSGGAAGAWVQMAFNPFYAWDRSTVGAWIASVKFDIALDAAGANIVASSSNLTVNVERI